MSQICNFKFHSVISSFVINNWKIKICFYEILSWPKVRINQKCQLSLECQQRLIVQLDMLGQILNRMVESKFAVVECSRVSIWIFYRPTMDWWKSVKLSWVHVVKHYWYGSEWNRLPILVKPSIHASQRFHRVSWHHLCYFSVMFSPHAHSILFASHFS